jgi:hypothetical protein
MAITQSITNTFKQQLLLGVHDFRPSGGDTFKLALYTSAADLNASTAAYTTTGEVLGLGYTAGGQSLTGQTTALTSSTAFLDFADLTFVNITVIARGCLIYNSTPSANDNANNPLTNPAVCALDFGGDKQTAAGDLTIVFPTPSTTTALIRIT